MPLVDAYNSSGCSRNVIKKFLGNVDGNTKRRETCGEGPTQVVDNPTNYARGLVELLLEFSPTPLVEVRVQVPATRKYVGAPFVRSTRSDQGLAHQEGRGGFGRFW